MNLSPDSQSQRAVSFIVLPENRLAYTAAMNWAASEPESGPVFLYGPSGIGKSHLVNVALQRLLQDSPETRHRQETASSFSADLTEALSRGSVRKFQRSYRETEVVILEDLQALERRAESQQQLLALMDFWESHQVRLLVTARKPPGELEGFSPKLISRFHAAVNASLRPFSPPSRGELIRLFAQDRGLILTDDVVQWLALESPGSPRELQGLVTRLFVHGHQIRSRLDLQTVKRFLQGDPAPVKLTLNEITRSVAQHFGIPMAQMRSKRRLQVCVLPRQCAMFLARELTNEHLARIGQFFSGRDHSTVVRACQKLDSILPDDPELRQHLTQIRKKLGLNQ